MKTKYRAKESTSAFLALIGTFEFAFQKTIVSIIMLKNVFLVSNL